ncbi:hypothetical protein C8R47DRAFT_530134 [Mycena vitilis]|nr:hypothetical protein C8R47DRAFT_530134 [Mycena vitilis]
MSEQDPARLFIHAVTSRVEREFVKQPNKHVSLSRTTTIPSSLSLHKNAKTRRIAFPQTALSCRYVSFFYISLATFSDLLFALFFQKKTRREANVAPTCHVTCPTDVAHVFSTTEAPRSGAENVDTIYRRPANYLNPPKKAAGRQIRLRRAISPCPADAAHVFNTTEAPRSGADNFDTIFQRPVNHLFLWSVFSFST